MLYYVIHEDLEDEEGDLVVSEKAYPEKIASEKAEALAEKYPNAYCDIMAVEDHYMHQYLEKMHQHLTKPKPLS